jgi:Glycosyltransferase
VDFFQNHIYYKNFSNIVDLTYKLEPERLRDIVNIIPKKLFKDERFLAFKHKFGLPKKWSEKSVVIYCGQAWEEWSPSSVITGIGGSEEAVIYLSKELVKLGWEVTVFNSCGEMAGIYDGVEYCNWQEFNANDIFNIVISWRNNIFIKNIPSKKKIIWLHDVPPKEQYSGDFLNTFDKVVTLSKFHDSLIPQEVPGFAKYISSNGINIEDFKCDGIERNPKRIIYTSSYDRGIIHLLEMWDDILKEVPDAELHLFYGWNTWMKMEEVGSRPKEYRLAMQKLMQKPNVFEHGRIGHKELVKEFFKSGIYAYPSHFEEISCISAMKAQACGCVALTTDYAALNETNKYGVKISGRAGEGDTNRNFKETLIDLLKHPEKQEEYRNIALEHKEEWGWDRVAKDWSENLLPLKKIEYKDLEEYKSLYKMGSVHNKIPLENNLFPVRMKRAIDFIKDHPEIKTGIDLGSFDGSMAVRATQELKPNFQCDTMDIRDKEFDYARKIIKEENLPVDVYTGMAIEEFDSGKKYDIALLMEVLEHTINPKQVIKHIETLLSDKGYLWITVPDKDGVFGTEHDMLYNSSHLRDYTEETLRQEIPEEFEILDVFKEAYLITLIARKK